jgi:hypothetical protein
MDICERRKGTRVASGWIISEQAGRLRIARQPNLRWDLKVRATFPICRRRRLGQQILQDMWRNLQDVRGFCPAVELWRDADLVVADIGGDVQGRFARGWTEGRITDLVNDARLRARWERFARIKGAM